MSQPIIAVEEPLAITFKVVFSYVKLTNKNGIGLGPLSACATSRA